jgi:hypothetical protein
MCIVENISRHRSHLNDRGAIVLRIADGDKRYSRLVQVIEPPFSLERKLTFEKPRALILVVARNPIVSFMNIVREAAPAPKSKRQNQTKRSRAEIALGAAWV